MFRNIFECHDLEERGHLVSRGQGYIPRCRGQPAQQKLTVQYVNSTFVEKPCLILTQGIGTLQHIKISKDICVHIYILYIYTYMYIIYIYNCAS